MAIQKLDKSNFKSTIESSNNPVIIDFYADWCGPCKMIAPIVHEIAAESDAYKVCKINVDDSPELAAKYGVMSIPTLIVLKNGAVHQQTVGACSKAAILAMLV